MTVTLAAVAARAGVSPATVSRVLNGNYPVAEETRKRVEAAVRDLDYVVNAHARALLHATSGMVGVILNDMSDPFFALIARGIQLAAADTGRMVVTCNSGGDEEREFAYIEMLRRQRADAVVLVGAAPEDPVYQDRIAVQARGLLSQRSRLVLCGRPLLSTVDLAVDVVAFDNVGGARAITEHLISLGHRDFAYIAGPAHRTTTSERESGFRAALAEVGVDVPAELVDYGNFQRDSGYDAAQRMLGTGRRFTALVAANDLMAVGVLSALRRAGVRVPEDVSVVGLDDVPVAQDVTPGLTTVRLPLERAGRMAVELAFGGEGSPGEPLGYELVLRASTAPPPGG